jgi:hypothetical protein
MVCEDGLPTNFQCIFSYSFTAPIDALEVTSGSVTMSNIGSFSSMQAIGGIIPGVSTYAVTLTNPTCAGVTIRMRESPNTVYSCGITGLNTASGACAAIMSGTF